MRFHTSKQLFTTALYCVSLFFLCIPSYAQLSTGIIKGHITTSDGKPASGVTVVLKELKKTTVADDNGIYELKNIKAGDYTLLITFTGLESQEKKITVTANKTTVSDFTLAEKEYQLQSVTVTAFKSNNERVVSVGKSGIVSKDLPQAISIIDKEVLERQQVLTLGDVLMNTNGVYMMGTTGGTIQEVAARGFLFNSTNTFKNGMRFNNGVMPEMSGAERVEFLKGSTAILLGNVTAGGVLNIVTKKPSFEKGGELSIRTGSYDFYKPSLDIYGPIEDSKIMAYRINTTFEKERSFRDNVTAQRYYINPSFLIKPNNKTQILVEGDYLTEKRTPDFGIGAINYTINNVPRSRFIGAAWSYDNAQEGSLTITTTHQFNDNWQIRNISGFYNYTNELFSTLRPDDGGGPAIENNGNWVRGVQRTLTNEDYYLTQVDLTGKFTTASIKHQFLLGFDADKYQTNTLAYNTLFGYDSINVFNIKEYPQRTDIPGLSLNTLTKAPLNRFGIYAQDLIIITNKLKVLAGVRFSYQQTIANVFTYSNNTTTNSATFAHPFTPRFGIVYQPQNNISLFTSYANSFALNTGVDTNGHALPPSCFTQYEAGCKTEWFNKVLSFNVTLYHIVETNVAQMSLANGNTNSNIKDMAGQVTSKGIEVDITTKPVNGFNFMAGYSYNDSRYTQSNLYTVGSRLQYQPGNTANASVYYTFSKKALKGFNVGIVALYVGNMYAGRETRVYITNDNRQLIALPNFVQTDVSAGYSFNKVSVRVKLTNVLNVLSYYAHEDGSINPIAPRELAATISCKL